MRRLSLVTVLALTSCDALTISDEEFDEARLAACVESLSDYCQNADMDAYWGWGAAESVYQRFGLDAQEDKEAKLLSICEDVGRGLDDDSNCFCYQRGASGQPAKVVDCSSSGSFEKHCLFACTDCDDDDATVHPGAKECDSEKDGIDNDCDEIIDEDFDVTTIYYLDDDGDGYGVLNSTIEVSSCDDPPDGYVEYNTDCDDSDSAINPGQVNEGPCGDGIDQNCDGDPGDCALYQAVDVSKPGFNGLSFVGATTSVAWHGLGTDEAAYFAVGYPGSVDVEGKVDIYRGEDSGPKLIATLTGDENSGFGSSLAAGDFNSDEMLDLSVGAPAVSQVHVYSEWANSNQSSIAHGGSAASVSNLGVTIQKFSSAATHGLLIAYSETSSSGKTSDSVWILDSPLTSSKSCESGDTCLEDFRTATDWPLALASATFDEVTYVGVGASASGAFDDYPGLAVYLDDGERVLTLTDRTTGTSSALGASVCFGTFSDDTSVVVGAPGTEGGKGAVYLLLALSSLSSQADTHFIISSLPDGSQSWSSTKSNDQAGSTVAFIGDIDLDGDEDLAIGGNGTLWIIEQSKDGFPGGDLDEVASGKITGVGGIIRHIVNAGDVDGDLFSDLLISTDSTTYLLYGGYKPAQEDASGTGN
jgi:hypothetical protein